MAESSTPTISEKSQSNSRKIIRRKNNKYKETAGRPVDSLNFVEEGSEEDSFIPDLMEDQNDQNDQEVPNQNNMKVNEERCTQDEATEENLPGDKMKTTKFKRKKDNQSPRRKPNILYPTAKYRKIDNQANEGAKHLNKAKEELKTRNSPRQLSEMIYYLTEEQREWVRRSGFGPLLDFQLEMLPSKLMYNIFQIFESNGVSLRLKNGEINIREEDVFDVLGLPHGGRQINLGSAEKYKERIDEWMTQFPTAKEKDQITTQKLVQLMRHEGLTDNFKLNFLIVMSNVLIGTTSCSYMDKQLLRFDDSLDNFSRYNWSEYLINYLVLATQSWNRTMTPFFRGSMIFLTLLYVDRVRHKGIKLVERQFPSYKGWTEDKLKDRQTIELFHGVFGIGSILPPLREIIRIEPDPNEIPNKANLNNDNENVDGDWERWANEWDNQCDGVQQDNVWNTGHDDKNEADLNNENVDGDWERWANEWDNQWDSVKQDNVWKTGHNDANEVCNDKEQQKAYMEQQPENDTPAENYVEILRARAQEILYAKIQFDEDLKKAKEKYVDNDDLLTIDEIFNQNFYSTKNSDHQTCGDKDADDSPGEDIDFTPEAIEHIDLVEYMCIRQGKININDKVDPHAKDQNEPVPSFSLGIDNIVTSQEDKDVNEEIAGDLITPQPMQKEKSTRLKRISQYAKSPYVDRVIDIKKKYNSFDLGLWAYIMHKENPLDIVYNWKGIMCIKEHIQTLLPQSSLYYSVIDSWSSILNENEKYKSDESPMRFFCTIGALVFSLDVTKKVSDTFPIFVSVMDTMFENFNIPKLDNIEMVFFPINSHEHFYLICYNLKNPGYHLIDNIKRDDNPKICYGKIPQLLHSHFCNYLNEKEFRNLGKRFRKMKPVYMRMPWQTSYNGTDCGIFIMRHMETFKGDVNKFNPELDGEGHSQEKQIMRLRVKYNTAILSSHLNEMRDPILKKGAELYAKAAERKLLKLVIDDSAKTKKNDDENRSAGKKKVTFATNLATTFEDAQ